VNDSGIPDRVKAFIRDCIDSIEQLEALLLLRRTPRRPWSADAVSAELRTNADSAGRRLADLARLRLLDVVPGPDGGEPRYVYHLDGAHDGVVADLDRAYAERRVTVVNLVIGKPLERVRTFADAFYFRSERPPRSGAAPDSAWEDEARG